MLIHIHALVVHVCLLANTQLLMEHELHDGCFKFLTCCKPYLKSHGKLNTALLPCFITTGQATLPFSTQV